MRSKTYEFNELSDAREVVEHQVPRFMLWFFYFVLATLSLLLVWSYVGTKEIVVQTQGMVKPQATQSVVPLVNSSVLAVHFQEGDFVQAGDLIVELDGRAIESDIANYDAALEQLLTNHQLEMLLLESIEIEENLFDVDNLNHITKYYEVKNFLDMLELSNNPEQEKRIKKANVKATIDQQAQTISQYENEFEKLEQ
ncbi:biotin/lipoyl-binding protein [Liberiplasma polymorphum]|uniref:biotin/lipoyl-binding protein n=1 Tax=Liberiplasma polymorphum TaxID=3374570 RepID=UPI0037756961